MLAITYLMFCKALIKLLTQGGIISTDGREGTVLIPKLVRKKKGSVVRKSKADD